ncbi:hypothetical protein CRG98_017636 [Punica granatum]|uniref:Chromo domain-containing protein n=1 Tax=Punica granatum TaxID=22663 RepID=A0A2I0K1C4_PUNGR|nr:hypothetical protein CRG98_017636 [Punica granatum]
MEWESPTKVTELRLFLGLANYYRRFIKDYSSITVPLTDLLKKARAWEWTDECQAAFDRLKQVVTDEPVLALPCYEKSFEVETDASDFAIGGVLMQDGHPIAFESRKLSDVERRYTYATFIPAKKDCPAEEATRLFMKHVVKYWGVPTTIVSDRDPRFTGRFWTELFKLLGTSLNFSTSLHPQTDGQTERLHNILRHKDVHKGFTRRYEGPFQILQRVGNVAYKVELPKKLKLHPVFHVSMLKPFQEDKQDPSRAESSRAPIGAKAAYDQDVEQILADRVVRKRWCKPKREYLIKWKGLPESEASWEPAEDLWQFTKQIEAFYAEDATRASPE